MNLRRKVSKQDFFLEYIKVLNGILRLSNREAEVFSMLLAIDDYGASENINTKEIRDTITKFLGISEPNLSRYLNTLKVKKLIVRGPLGWVINDYIRPPKVVGGVLDIVVTLEIDTTNEDKNTLADFLGSDTDIQD